jgi:RNA polymerase sigma-70 factor, ECF subfamily
MKQDKDILEGLRQSREDAQRQLLLQYGDRVFSTVVRIVPCREDAEEVYQDVFMKVFRNIGTYDAGKASFSTWLMRIAYHEALNFARRNKLHWVSFEDNMPATEPISKDELDAFFGNADEETVAVIEHALQQITPYEQSLISMYYYQDMPIKEIAYITDMLPASVSSRLFKIRQKLYYLIKKERYERR